MGVRPLGTYLCSDTYWHPAAASLVGDAALDLQGDGSGLPRGVGDRCGGVDGDDEAVGQLDAILRGPDGHIGDRPG